MRISPAALPVALGVLLAASPGGSATNEASGQQHGRPAPAAGGGEEAAPQYGLTDTCNVARAGVRWVLSYDAAANAFVGTVENTTRRTLRRVRTEVRLSNGIGLDPTTLESLFPGQTADLRLPASPEPFETWSAHLEVEDGAEEEDGTAPAGVEAAARRLLAEATAAAEEEAVTLVSAERVDWGDASLGCAREGMAYAAVVTPGYELVFALGDASYAVHTNMSGSSVVLCGRGE